MRIQILLLAGLLGACTMAAAPAYYGYGQATSSDLVGRVAGAPERCIPIQRDYTLRTASGDPNALVYGLGSKIWVNRLAPGCTLDPNSTLVVRPLNSMSYCENDLVEGVGYGSFPGRTCNLNAWVPYTKVAR